MAQFMAELNHGPFFARWIAFGLKPFALLDHFFLLMLLIIVHDILYASNVFFPVYLLTASEIYSLHFIVMLVILHQTNYTKRKYASFTF